MTSAVIAAFFLNEHLYSGMKAGIFAFRNSDDGKHAFSMHSDWF